MAPNVTSVNAPKIMRRTRVLSNPVLRMLARALVHLQPHRLGEVSAAYEGVFRIRPCGLSLKYELGPSDAVGNVLLWCGPRNFEIGTISTFAKLARRARGVLDMGANTGLYSMMAGAANPDSRIIAWEPVPYLFRKLQANIALNSFTHRCDLRPNALSDTNGHATLYVPLDTTMASLNPTFWNHETSPIDVVVETADSAVPPDFPVDLIKLDVESYEFPVLCGMRGILARHRPALIFECLPTTPSEPIEKLLRDLGYNLHRITSTGPVPIRQIVPDETANAHNYLATQ
jgi:FkbM family methyltransferase